MFQSKLLELLRSFSVPQWRRFGDFLRSPYFNKREEPVILYDYLSPFHPEFRHKRLERSNVIRALNLPVQEGEKQLAYLMSQTLALAERFLAADALNTRPAEATRLQLDYYRLAGLHKHFNSAADKLRRQLASFEWLDTDYYRLQFELAWQSSRLAEDPHRHQANPALQEAADRLDDWYLAHLLRFRCEMASQERMLAVQYDNRSGIDPATFLQGDLAEREPALVLWYYAWRCTRHDDPADFERLLALLQDHGHRMEDPERKALYTYALNFCTRRINQDGALEYYDRYLEINDYLLENGLLLENGAFPPWRFLNIASAGIRTGQWARTHRFIQRWHSQLPPDYAANLHGYTLAQWHYAQQQYAAAQKALATVEFQDLMLALAARSLLVRIYFEAGETELLFAALEANRIWLLRNKKLEAGRRRQVQQFIDFTRRLARIDPPDPAKLRALAEQIPSASAIMHRDWLLEQCRRLVEG